MTPNRSSKLEVIDAEGNITEYTVKCIRQYLSEIGRKGGAASKGTEAAKIRSAKANAAKKAKKETNKDL